MINLSEFTEDELVAEIKRRRWGDKPPMLQHTDFNKLVETCQKYINYVDSDDYHEDNDWSHYIYEAVIETLYGKDVWKWINNRHG